MGQIGTKTTATNIIFVDPDKVAYGVERVGNRPTVSTDVVLDASSTAGGQKYIFVQDEETRNTLGKILKQLKIMNMHLALMGDNHIKPSDLEI
jgi:hypothetical protein